VRTVLDEGLGAHAAEMGAYLSAGLTRLRDAGAPITAIRERGLMVGLDLATESAAAVVDAARDRGALFNATGPATLRMVPPLILSHDEADHALEILAAVLGE